MSIITRLESENVKRLKAIQIDTNGEPVVTIGGTNGNGKTSVLDSIMYALAGKDAVCAKPIRNGQDHADVLLETDDGLIVRRKWRTSKSGNVTTAVELSQRTEFGEAAVKSPQAILDSLCGRMAFDPLEFSRMKPAAQLAALKELVGVDTDAIDGRIDQLFRERTEINRKVKELEGQVAGAVTHADAPDAEVSVSALLDELRKAEQANRAADALQRQADEAKRNADFVASKVVEARRMLEQLEAQHSVAADAAATAEATAASAVRLPVDGIKEGIANAEVLNRKVRENVAAKSLAIALDAAKADAKVRSEAIDELRVSKTLMMSEAKWPVEGLGFGEGGIELNGLPFDQASAAEKLRVSVAMGFAMNPKLKVLLIRDGSLLDDNSMRLVREMATEAGGQLFIELVTADAEACSILIEDGEVRAREPAEAELAAV